MIVQVLSDVHGDLAALDAALAEGRRRGAARVVCLGDLVESAGAPGNAACAERLVALGPSTVWLRGNHDAWFTDPLIRDLADEGLVEPPPALPEALRLALRARPHMLVEGDVTWAHTHTLDENCVEGVASPFAWSHGGGIGIRQALDDAGTRLLFSGHTHVPFVALAPPRRTGPEAYGVGDGPVLLAGRRAVVNPGSVHANFRDGSRTFALWDTGRDTVEFVSLASGTPSGGA